MADRNGMRREGVRRLAVGLLLIPYMLAVLTTLLVLGVPLWLLNNLFQIVFGRGFLGGNSRFGYYWYWAQSNIQWAITGRGDASWMP